jgi:outer membrane protein assembly factor BamB
MQQFQPDSAPDMGNSDEQSLVIEDLPVEAAQNQTTTTRKSKWQRSFPSLLAGGILLLVAVVVSARLLPQAPAGQPSPGTASRTAPLSTPTPTPIVTGGPEVADHSVYPTVVDGLVYVSTSANLTYALTASTGALLWRATTQGTTYEPPVVAHGIVYVNTHPSELVSFIYALQATDGKLLWSHVGENPFSVAHVANDIVYEASVDGIIAARANDGSTLWSYTAKGRDAPSVYGIRWVSDGVVYGSVFPYSNTGPSGSTTTLFALRERDGSLLWSQRGALLTENDNVIYSADGNTLCAVQAGDGKQRWCRVIGPENTSLQTLDGPAVFAGILSLFTTTFNSTAALQGSPGQSAWAMSIRPPGQGRALVSGQARLLPASLMLSQKEGQPSVYAIRAADGTILWSHLLNEGKNGWISGFGVERGVLYAGINDEARPGGQVYALQSQTGKESWRTTSATAPTYGVLAPGMLYISSASGSADALNLRDGSRLWHNALTGEIHSQPVLAGDTLYIGASSGVLSAFDSHHGALRWQYPAP